METKVNNLPELIGKILGPAVFLYIFLGHPFETLNPEANATLAVTLWVSIWWITEAIPIPVVSLMPIVLMPLTGAASINITTAAYGDKLLFLFMGGFVIAIAMEKWDLHKRIALNIINKVGISPEKLLLGFMASTAFLSMWISNTSTTLMMVTIASAVIVQLGSKLEGRSFHRSLLLGVAYAANIGGIATLIGTPPNAVFAAQVEKIYGIQISFLDWMYIGVPISIIFLVVTYLFLTKFVFKLDKMKSFDAEDLISNEIKKLGKISYEEKMVSIVFCTTAFLWITQSFLIKPFLPSINDTTIAIFALIIFFLIPTKSTKSRYILTWEEAVKLPWGIILLFGGGLAIAASFKSSGLALWIGNQIGNLDFLGLYLVILIITLSINCLTEVTSNTAIVSVFLPILVSFAEPLGVHPFYLMVPATIAGSCAFMLPVATPPNAIVFATGHLKIQDMVKAGVWLNITTSLIISLISYFLLDILFDLSIIPTMVS